MQTIDVKLAREYVIANYPNDPLLKHIALTLLDQLPKVDAPAVVQGHWTLKVAGQGTSIHECSNCRSKVAVCCDIEYAARCVVKENPFCAKCGAMMDGGKVNG